MLIALGTRVLDWIGLTGGAAGAVRWFGGAWEAAAALYVRRQRRREMGPVLWREARAFPKGLGMGKEARQGERGI